MRPFLLVRFLLTFTLLSTSAIAQSAAVSGLIVDQDARPIPRALVTATDAEGRELARTFTALDGSFILHPRSAGGCFLTAQLTGFLPVHTDCVAANARRIVLAVAPLEEVIIVSATRGEAPAAQVAPSTTVFTARDMDRHQRPLLPDLLRASAGTTVVGAGAPGGVTSLFVRGGESSYTKVLLDGIPLNDPGGAFDLSNVTTAHLGRVELVRGAHSALFGTDAVAGVLQMFTARARPGDPETEIHIEGGSVGSVRGGITYARASHTWDYSLHASSLLTDNDVPNNEFTNTTLSAAGGRELDERTSLRFVARAEIGEAGAPGQVAFGRPDLDAAYGRRYGTAGAAFRQQLSATFHHSARYSFAASSQASANLKEDRPYLPRFRDSVAPFPFSDFLYSVDDRHRRHHAGYQVDWRLTTSADAGLHLLTAAVEWDGERATLEDRLAADATRASRDNAGGTLQHQILWPRVFLTGGLRLQHNGSFGFAAVPRASVAFIARESDGFFGSTRLKAAAGAGVKAPTIRQSFSTTPFALGNPDLEPERSRTLDAGLEQTMAGGAARIEVTGFANRFRDIISTRTLAFNPFRAQYFNIGLTRARGIEISGELSSLGPFRVRGGYTHMRSRVLESAAADDDPVFGVGRGLFRRPRHSGFVDVEFDRAPLAITALGTFTGRGVDSDFSALVPPLIFNEGHKRWDVRATYEISPRVRVHAAVDNLFDNRYMEPLGYPVVGRAARAGLNVTF